jgi:hypothetical protein
MNSFLQEHERRRQGRSSSPAPLRVVCAKFTYISSSTSSFLQSCARAACMLCANWPQYHSVVLAWSRCCCCQCTARTVLRLWVVALLKHPCARCTYVTLAAAVACRTGRCRSQACSKHSSHAADCPDTTHVLDTKHLSRHGLLTTSKLYFQRQAQACDAWYLTSGCVSHHLVY